jgi:hypothetical protein
MLIKRGVRALELDRPINHVRCCGCSMYWFAVD